VDILVNNAGVIAAKSLVDLSENEIRRTMDVNVMAHFWTLKEFLPDMIKRRSGHIVCISSMAGKAVTQLLTDYCASKFAAHALNEALEFELRYLHVAGINFTTVYPAAVDTRMMSEISQHAEFHQRFGPLLKPEEVAKFVVDGVLYNKRHVYIPSDMRFFPLILAILPAKAIRIFADFVKTELVQKKRA